MRFAILRILALAYFAGPLASQIDPASIRKKADAATKRVGELQTRCTERVAAARKSVGDDDNKVQGDLDDIANKVTGQDFAAGLGSIPIAESHLEYVSEGARPAFQAALAALRKTLEEAAEARAQMDACQLLADRLENLQAQVKDGNDVSSPLRDLDDTLNQAKGSKALSKDELAALRAHLAGHTAAARKRRHDELRERAKTALAELEAEYPTLQKSLAERTEREGAVTRFDQAASAILDSLLLLPAEEPAAIDMRARLAKLEGPVRAAYSKLQAVATGERLKANLDFQAYMFDGWQQETGTLSAEEYLQLSCTVELLGYKKTASLVNLANPWFAFVANDSDYQKITPDPKFAALHASMLKDRDAAVARMIGVSESLVADIEKLGLADQSARDRAAYLADWDLRMVLQEHPKQWELIARLHKLTDAFDRRTLGDAAALAKMREEEAKALDSQWNRMSASVPIAGGFVGDQCGKFRGKIIRIQAGRDFSDEFAPGDFDLVFRQDGELFAARYDPAAKAAVAAARERLQLRALPEDEYEIIAVVGAEGSLGLPSADGKSVLATLPCWQLRVIGVRVGPIGFLLRPGP